MQENEFEKQVKQVLENFKLSPPVAVWDEVSRKLEKEKKPKLPFIFLLVIGLAAAGYFIFNIAGNKTESSETTANKNNNTLSADSISLQDAAPTVTQSKSHANNEPVLSFNNKNSTKPEKKLYAADKSIISTAITQQPNEVSQATSNHLPETQQHIVNVDTNQVYLQVNPKIDSSLFVRDTTVNKNFIVQQEIKDTSSAVVVSLKYDSLKLSNRDSIVMQQNKTVNAGSNSIKKPILKNSKLPNWQWGITAFYGGSNAIESLVDFNKSAPANSFSPGINQGNNDTTAFNGAPYISSNAYYFGAVLQKKILKNGFIAAGLNFTHLSTKSNVNEKVDALYVVRSADSFSNGFMINEYYQAGSSTTQTNTYNFIELPVYLQQDFFYEKKLSLSYNAGFSVRQLISSNALIYNPSGNIYYSKDELLRKTQLQLLAGLNLKINTGKSTALYVGPQFSYSLSNLLKNNDDGNFHFISYGLQASLMFHKK